MLLYLLKSSYQIIFKMKLLYRIFCVTLLINIAYTNWTDLIDGTINLPPHVFNLNLIQGQILAGRLHWNVRADLDIYIFKEGTNIINNTAAIVSFIQYYQNEQTLQYTPSQSGLYYLKVYAFNLFNNNYMDYTLDLSINNVNQVSYGAFHRNSMRGMPIFIPNILNITKIKFKYQSNVSSSNTAVLTTSKAQPSARVGLNQTPCFANSDNIDSFVLIIRNYDSLAYYLTPVTYSLQYDYVQDDGVQCLAQSFIDDQDDQDNGVVKTYDISIGAIIAICVIVPICFIAVFVSIAVCIFKKYISHKKQVRIEEIQNSRVIRRLESTQTNLRSQENCCICLGENCDSSLPCNHYFHQDCIKQWVKKNNLCPLCRSPIL